MRRRLGSMLVGGAVLAFMSPVQANGQDATARLGRALEVELALWRSAASVREEARELARERASVEHAHGVLAHASSESMRRIDAYRVTRIVREREARARARALYKLARGGVARLAFEDLDEGQGATCSRVARGRALRRVVRHALTELSVYRRAEARAHAELLAATRERDALAALRPIGAMQQHALAAFGDTLGTHLEAATVERQRWWYRSGREGARAHTGLLQQVELHQARGRSRPVRPVPGRIVGSFGEYTDPLLRLPMIRNGVELQAAVNEPVRALEGGRVVAVTALPSLEQAVVIEHERGAYTLTARLWQVEVAEGEEVEAGQRLGRVAPKAIDDGLGPTVYLELRHGEQPVDPADRLQGARAVDPKR